MACIRELKGEIEDIEAELIAMGNPKKLPKVPMDDQAVERFTARLEALFLGEDRSFAQRYLRTVIDEIVVDDGVVHVHAKATGVAQVAPIRLDLR